MLKIISSICVKIITTFMKVVSFLIFFGVAVEIAYIEKDRYCGKKNVSWLNNNKIQYFLGNVHILRQENRGRMVLGRLSYSR